MINDLGLQMDFYVSLSLFIFLPVQAGLAHLQFHIFVCSKKVLPFLFFFFFFHFNFFQINQFKLDFSRVNSKM